MQLPFDASDAVKTLGSKDARLKRLIHEVGPFRMSLQRRQSTFHVLARAIVYQQLSGKAANTIFRRLVALYPGTRRLHGPRTWIRSGSCLGHAGCFGWARTRSRARS